MSPPFQPAQSDRGIKLGLFFVWLGLVLFIARDHVFWRDEVEVLLIALQGDNFIEMLRHVHGQGHPALWFLLLRTASVVAQTPHVLHIASITVAAAAMLLLVLRSPFSWWMIALLLFSEFALFEYSVMSRNYGISMLLMFTIAACYARFRDHGILLGILLALLVNTNAHSVILAGAFLLFWLTDIVSEHGIRWTPALRTFLFNAIIVVAGIAICIATIYPPHNDAASINRSDWFSPLLWAKAVFFPSYVFADLTLATRIGEAFNGHPPWSLLYIRQAMLVIMSLVMFGSLLGLIRTPGALVTGILALIGFSLFFVIIYIGVYRHQALWFVFVLSLYWIAREPRTNQMPRFMERFESLIAPAAKIGTALLVFFTAWQISGGVMALADAILDRPPHSRSRDLAAFISQRPDLKEAILISDFDAVLMSLHYYIDNRTYLMRNERFGKVVRYSTKARRSLNLDDILATARKLRTESNKPILILLRHKLDPTQPAQIYYADFILELHTTPEQVRTFLTSTKLLRRFDPVRSDESYDVYLYDGP